MLLRFFGLDEDPFGVTPGPRFLFPSHTHREALASLKYGLKANRGFTALMASPGLGKTTLLYRFLNDIRAFARSVFLFDIDADCSPRELIASILRDLGIAPDPTAAGMHDQLNKVLVEEARAGRTVVIVIDEAQNLSEAALEALRLLSNFETPRAKLLHIVLAGQLQLLDKLVQPSLVQLRQRITTFCRIDPLSAKETRDYIHHRLTIAGHRGEPLFSDESLDLISGASSGIPRTINNLCFNSLSICRALNQKQVTRSMVEEAIADFHFAPASNGDPVVPSLATYDERPLFSSGDPVSALLNRRTITAAVLCASIFAILGFSAIRLRQWRDISEPASLNSKIAPVSAPVPEEGKSSQLQAPAVQPAQPPAAQSAAIPSLPQRFRVKVPRHETLRDVSIEYLGEFNETRLREIRALNPGLINPDHVLAGQSIWLPGTPPRNLAQSDMTSNDPRSLP